MSKPPAIVVHGTGVNARTQCAHWHSERDIIAIKFKCCGTYYACIECHREVANHPSEVWPRTEFGEQAIYCGNCRHTLSISSYLTCGNACPVCQAAFNPGCANHYPLYFAQ